ncbi:MAG: class I SAM-dependent methyltransferase [Chloroflexi bacterium]|nr:class I SAM-dependent methyltransferase [Chloroflexota bacterium]MBK7917626.1 class I SAM-dependent methyltransferase [Chloroflexota bacterium]MBP6804006.1 class I SAM-dependent methyltransferase [Chloroflexota bacterium]MBP7590732.1 class I SAM-dependent methyltransferase [Chloroflexota bacterium]
MDTWKFFDITHKEHVICNPSSLEKFQRLIDLLRLSPGDNVLELATGKGEFLIRLAEQYQINGVGVDISPYCIRDAQAKLAARAPQGSITFLEMGGADYRPDEPESFDLTICLGASWIFDGHAGTLQALKQMTKPGGWLVVGEPYFLQEPDPVYLEMAGFSADAFGSHYENAAAGQALGLTLLYTLVSNHDEWDTYEGLQWYASETYALEHPDDPDVPELLARVRQQKEEYLRYGRHTLGWAIYVFRKA